jgi:hypothetical protein
MHEGDRPMEVDIDPARELPPLDEAKHVASLGL